MGNPAKDLTGQVFGYLTVTRRAGTTQGTSTQCALWECRCECGTIVVRRSQYLRTKHRPHPRSCGCRMGNETHKMSYTRPYKIWISMRRRCLDPRDKDYANYGGRGIRVCETWKNSFENFWADMREGYNDSLTLGRQDNNGDYSPQNCKWETVKAQSNNTRTNIFLETPKGKMTMQQAAELYGIKPVTLRQRLRNGWPLLAALTEPANQGRRFMTSSTAGQETGS